MSPAVAGVLALLAAAPGPGPQGPAARRPRVTLQLAGLAQFAGADATAVREYEELQETARLEQSVNAATAGGVELGLTVALTRRVGIAVAATASSRRAGGSLTASLPHPLYFGRPRQAALDTPDADRSEVGIHAGPVLFFRAGAFDVEAGGGVSWIEGRMAAAQRVEYEHAYPYDEVRLVGLTDRRLAGSGFGFHVGALVARGLGGRAGLFAAGRFTRATVEPAGEGTRGEIEAGGVQAVAGLRVSF